MVPNHRVLNFLVLVLGVINVCAGTRYVDVTSTNPIPPYTNWNTAAAVLQDAIDMAENGDIVLVTNGVYATGGRQLSRPDVTNRVAVTNAVLVQSVNGPEATFIQGFQVSSFSSLTNAVRCAFLGSNAMLSGFTLTNGSAGAGNYVNGGGVFCSGPSAIVSNCVLIGNYAAGGGGGACRATLVDCLLRDNLAAGGGAAIDSKLVHCIATNNTAGWAAGTLGCSATNCLLAWNHATNYGGASGFSTLVNCTLASNSLQPGHGGTGGGSHRDTLLNCLVTSNSATAGGGAYSSSLLNCTVVGNSALTSDGGAYSQSTVQNCILYYNTAPSSPNGNLGKFDYCCTTPVPTYSLHSFTNEPLFIDASVGDFRLQSNSPCINAGRNAYAPCSTDLAGQPRVVAGTVDIGAYEFQDTPFSVISFAWLQQYELLIDGSADYADTDGDGMNNWQEWRCGTVPTNADSVFRLLDITNSGSGVALTWSSVADRPYCVERAADLAQPAFSTLATNLWSYSTTRSYTDTTATNPGPYFYRVRLQE